MQLCRENPSCCCHPCPCPCASSQSRISWRPASSASPPWCRGPVMLTQQTCWLHLLQHRNGCRAGELACTRAQSGTCCCSELGLSFVLVAVSTLLQASLPVAAGGDVPNLDQGPGVVADCFALHHHLWILLPQGCACVTQGGHVQGDFQPAEVLQ